MLFFGCIAETVPRCNNIDRDNAIMHALSKSWECVHVCQSVCVSSSVWVWVNPNNCNNRHNMRKSVTVFLATGGSKYVHTRTLTHTCIHASSTSCINTYKAISAQSSKSTTILPTLTCKRTHTHTRTLACSCVMVANVSVLCVLARTRRYECIPSVAAFTIELLGLLTSRSLVLHVF